MINQNSIIAIDTPKKDVKNPSFLYNGFKYVWRTKTLCYDVFRCSKYNKLGCMNKIHQSFDENSIKIYSEEEEHTCVRKTIINSIDVQDEMRELAPVWASTRRNESARELYFSCVKLMHEKYNTNEIPIIIVTLVMSKFTSIIDNNRPKSKDFITELILSGTINDDLNFFKGFELYEDNLEHKKMYVWAHPTLLMLLKYGIHILF